MNSNTLVDASPPVLVEAGIPEAFSVTDAVTANWVVRKIVESRSYAKYVKSWADGEVRRAERDEAFLLQRYGHQLETWARAQIAMRRSKSIKLPAGTVGLRSERPKLAIADQMKLISWCRRLLPSALRIETHVMKSIVKDHVAQTGECPDGAEISGGGQQFFVR